MNYFILDPLAWLEISTFG